MSSLFLLEKVPWFRLVSWLLDFCRFQKNKRRRGAKFKFLSPLNFTKLRRGMGSRHRVARECLFNNLKQSNYLLSPFGSTAIASFLKYNSFRQITCFTVASPKGKEKQSFSPSHRPAKMNTIYKIKWRPRPACTFSLYS